MSPNAEKKTKRGVLIERVNALLKNPNPGKFEIEYCKREADKLKKYDPAAAYSVLGMVACLEKDIGNVHRYHQNAIKISGEFFLFLCHYATSLMNLDESEKAFPIAEKSFEKEPGYLKTIEILIASSSELGKNDKFKFYCDKWKAITGKDHKLASFPEDEDSYLEDKLFKFDRIIKECPELVVEPDPEIVSLAEDLIAGVEID